MVRRIRYRCISFRNVRILFLSICFLFIYIQFFSIKLFLWKEIPSSILTRLYPDQPITFNLHSYSVCHPNKLYLENLTSYYHYYSKQQEICFLIEHLDGEPWLSYVTHEFGEILTYLKELSMKSNITYRSFPSHTKFFHKTNLTKYFLNACDIDETLPQEQQIPMVILLWNIDRVVWNRMHHQWNHILKTTRTRVMVFIDDLHFSTKEIYTSRQYLFESVASEIFSTYPYLFHNYYNNISSQKITWLPHAASSLSYHSINQTAENILFVSGANLLDWYPCRWRAFLLCQSRKDLITCLKHPGYGTSKKNDSSIVFSGKRYFSYMKQYRFGLGTCQSVHYAIAKLFELPANGLALVTTNDLVPILEKLNLYHNEHFLTIDCSSKNQLIKEITNLQNISNDKINNIRIKSQEIIYERHMTQHRAELLYVRLLAQALIAISSTDKQRRQWEEWGRYCY